MSDEKLFWPCLMAFVHRIEYNRDLRRGTIFMPRGSCTDMRGAIRLFEHIDPEVLEIVGVAGDVPETWYRRQGRDWVAFATPRR